MKKPIFTGAGVAIITPFTMTGEVNYNEFKKIIDHQIAHGTDAIVIVGTTGEGCTMTLKEHAKVVDFGCSYVNGRVPVIAGTGSNDTMAAIELTREAAVSGADGVLSVTPYYNKTSQQGLVAHFSAIADCSECPVILYNVPSRTGLCISAQTYYELSKHPNINGTKEASGNFSLLAETMQMCGDALNVWSGNDDQIVPLMAMGGQGAISVLSNVAPAETHQMIQLCFEGKYDAARKLQLDYVPLINALFCDINPIPVKKAMELLGWDVGGLRLPLVDVSESHAQLIQSQLQKAGCKI